MTSNIEQQIISVGRFSSQLLAYRGAEKQVRIVNDTQQNTFANSQGIEVAPSPDSIILGSNNLVHGAVLAISYDSLRMYFISRGAGITNAATLALLTIDSAKIQGVSPMQLIEMVTSQSSGSITFSNDTFISQNFLRSPSNQVGNATNLTNSKSRQSRSIKG